jgi:glutamyl-tRNA synthetase
VPVIVNEKRQKLSKRRDKVALEAYRDEGYLAAAMRNYLMLLGWAPSGDREIVPWSVIEEEYRIEDVNHAPAFFDIKKLRAFNGDYIRALSAEDFAAVCAPWLAGTDTIPPPPWDPEAFDPAAFAAVAPLAQTRISVLSEIVEYVDFLFLDEPVKDDSSWMKAMKEGAGEILDAAATAFAALDEWAAGPLRIALEEVGLERGLKLGKVQAPVRVAVTGRSVGLPLFESIEVLGRERTLARLAAARAQVTV